MKRTLLSVLLVLSGVTAIPAGAQISLQPIDPQATGPTRQLYRYLRDKVWGQRVLSGCQARWDYNTTDADGIRERAGRYPAVNIFDFQHFRQRGLDYKGPTAKAWHDAGGIVGFIWHWSVPIDPELTPKDGFSFYTPSGAQGRRGTQFSPRRALQEGTPEQRIMGENLDTIVSYLLYYQEQDIPILWRPFHEAAGNTNHGGEAWFWWGSDGAEVFKKLYIYVQRYLMERGVHNLIYIWTSELDDDDWYPGDEYVDIVARDQYHAPSQHGSFKEQFDLLSRKYPSKMLALAECDCVPSAEAMARDDARWLFVAPWTVPFVFSQQNDDAFWKQFLAADLVLTRDEIDLSGHYRLSINKDSGVYERGERVVVTCHADEVPLDSIVVRVYYNNRMGRELRLLPATADFTVLEQALDSTCAVMVEVTERRGRQPAAIGYVVAPEGFRAGYDEPADLMDYWAEQKKQLKALPMQVKTSPLDVPEHRRGRYVCQDVEINCLGPAPVRAYMAKPVGAKKRSLPIVILCRAAGVSGSWCRCSVDECVSNAALGNGALSLDINAHGMLNGQTDDYYRMLEFGMLRSYYEHNAADRETYYFRGMYLRLLRAIEYMTRQPEWDGRRILVIGESQGGGQAVAAAGLDPRVSAVVLNVPAMQDLGGARAGRRSGWPQPIENHSTLDPTMMDATLPYFDGALLIRHSTAEIYCEMGLIDTTCPPSGVWASLNGAQGKKTVNCVPYRTHAWPSGEWLGPWNEMYYRPRLAFIDNYLR